MPVIVDDDKFEEWRNSGTFGMVTKLTGMPIEEWRQIAEDIPKWPSRLSLMAHLLNHSGFTPMQLYFFEDCVLQLYHGTIMSSGFSLYTRGTNERIIGKNEIVDPSASLTTDELRKICVMLEALVFKCVHLKLEGQSDSYRQRTETYELRLDRLVDEGVLDDNCRQLGQELYETRCEFAHSIQSIDGLRYLGKPLRERWGSRGTLNPTTLKRFFLPDAFRYSDELLAIFKPLQGFQIDPSKFRAELINVMTNPDILVAAAEQH